MNVQKVRNSFVLVLAAFIWGVAFVAQSSGGDAVGPYTFNATRSLIGGCVLIPTIFFLDKMKLTNRQPKTKEDKKMLLKGGISCGVVLFVASNLQQLGITAGTPVGKAGFLTACYIILVPILGLFLNKSCSVNVWVGVALTVVGLYLLCITDGLSFQKSDILLLLCAFVFSLHILVIDHYSPLVDGVRMSCIQFFVAGVLTIIPMMITEVQGDFGTWFSLFHSVDAWIPILYAGVCSSGIAYTLQIVGQQGVNPTVASLLLSLESVFSVVAGALLLHQVLSTRELMGCLLIFVAVVLAQIPVFGRNEK